jgi:hypothetical protein
LVDWGLADRKPPDDATRNPMSYSHRFDVV